MSNSCEILKTAEAVNKGFISAIESAVVDSPAKIVLVW